MLIVDDGSPDGTGKLADAISNKDERVHVLHRTHKQGLGTAYVAGFRWGLARITAASWKWTRDFSPSIPGARCRLFCSAALDAGVRRSRSSGQQQRCRAAPCAAGDLGGGFSLSKGGPGPLRARRARRQSALISPPATKLLRSGVNSAGTTRTRRGVLQRLRAFQIEMTFRASSTPAVAAGRECRSPSWIAASASPSWTATCFSRPSPWFGGCVSKLLRHKL